MKMSKGAEEAMNNLRADEAKALYVQGYVVIVGNGQVCSIVRKEEAEGEEIRRCQNGY